MQAVAVDFIIGVVQDSVETALNSSGDVFFTATAEEFDRKKKGEIGSGDIIAMYETTGMTFRIMDDVVNPNEFGANKRRFYLSG